MMKTIRLLMTLSLLSVLALGPACKSGEKPAAGASPAAGVPATAVAALPNLQDKTTVLDVLRNGDPADVMELLRALFRDRQGWADGAYDDYYRPLWHLFTRLSAPEAGTANAELQTALHNIFNLGDWYPLLDEFFLLIASQDTPAAVRQAAAQHLWRFAGMDKSGQGFFILPADRPRIEAAVTGLLGDADPELISTAATTAQLLGLKTAVPRLKEIIAARTGDTTEARALRFTVGEALFGLGETKAALDAMTALASAKGDFSEEAAEFLKKNGKQ